MKFDKIYVSDIGFKLRRNGCYLNKIRGYDYLIILDLEYKIDKDGLVFNLTEIYDMGKRILNKEYRPMRINFKRIKICLRLNDREFCYCGDVDIVKKYFSILDFKDWVVKGIVE